MRWLKSTQWHYLFVHSKINNGYVNRGKTQRRVKDVP